MPNSEVQYNDSSADIQTPIKIPCSRWLSVLVILARVVVGATFIVSGVVKLIDPMGTMYKIEDYLAVLDLSFFAPGAYVVAVLLSMVEFVLGFNTLLGSYLRTTPILLLIFMGIMTPLTLYLAIANPIADCGCFGDFIVLSNWQTFAKNVVLLSLVIFLFRFNTRKRSVFHREIHALIVIWVVFFGSFLVWIAANYTPILDFRPYKLGVDLAANYFGDDDTLVEYDFVYENNGVQEVFDIEHLPDESQGWHFVERRERASKVQLAENNQLDHFVVYDGDEDITEEVLSHEGYVFMIFSESVVNANDDDVNKIHELYDYTQEYHYPFYAVTASSPTEIENWLDNTGGEFSFVYMDRTTIRTIDRANPFLMVLKDGVIYHKYPIEHLPDEALLVMPVEQIEGYAVPHTYNARYRMVTLALVLFIPIVVLYFTERVALFLLRRFRRWRKERAVVENEDNNQ